jgi:predicted nucleotidyltransferase component of viral defense system
MKEHLLSLIQPQTDPIQARNQAREYLQALILQSMQRAGALVPLAFHGGTALRFLYGSERYSEDLDFALEGDPKEYDQRAFIQTIRRDLEAQGYKISLKISTKRWFRTPLCGFRVCLSNWDCLRMSMKPWQ